MGGGGHPLAVRNNDLLFSLPTQLKMVLLYEAVRASCKTVPENTKKGKLIGQYITILAGVLNRSVWKSCGVKLAFLLYRNLANQSKLVVGTF